MEKNIENSLRALQLISSLYRVIISAVAVDKVFKEKVNKDMFGKLIDCNQIVFQNEYSFTIQTNYPESIRKQIMQLSLDNELNIISMNSERQQLEEIFKSLTN